MFLFLIGIMKSSWCVATGLSRDDTKLLVKYSRYSDVSLCVNGVYICERLVVRTC